MYLCHQLGVRDVAQLVARHVRDVEVDSSSLFIPTDFQIEKMCPHIFSIFVFLTLPLQREI